MAERPSTNIAEGDFRAWVTVKTALQVVTELEPHQCMDILKARIRSGRIKVAARRVVEFDREGRETATQHFARIHAKPWIDHADDRFWTIGDHSFRLSRDDEGYNGTYIAAEIEGVRLEPDALEELRLELGGLPRADPEVLKPAQISRAPAPITPLRGRTSLPPTPTVQFGQTRRIDHFAEMRRQAAEAVDAASEEDADASVQKDPGGRPRFSTHTKQKGTKTRFLSLGSKRTKTPFPRDFRFLRVSV